MFVLLRVSLFPLYHCFCFTYNIYIFVDLFLFIVYVLINFPPQLFLSLYTHKQYNFDLKVCSALLYT